MVTGGAHKLRLSRMLRLRIGSALACVTCVTIVCLCFAASAAYCQTLKFGSVDDNKEKAKIVGEQAIKDAGLSIDINDADVLRIGASFAVDQGETIEGDIVIIGGALTVEGTVLGDAVVVGGSMYLASTSVVKGDVVVMGGILEREDGATVLGQVVEKPEESIDLGDIEGLGEPEEPRNVEPVEEPEGLVNMEGPEGIVKISEDIHVEEGQVIHGDVVSVSADIRIDGEVEGDVVATSGDIELGPTARVTGDVVSVFGEVEMEEGATVDGDVVETSLVGERTVIRSKSKIKEAQESKAAQKIKGEWAASKTVRYRISLYAPDAKDVRLTGTFVKWDPEGVPMKRDDEGTWLTYYDFPPGSHLYKFIVDGKPMPDPDEPDKKTEDGMGGYATVLTVPAKGKSETAVPIKFSLYRPEVNDVRVTGTFTNWDPEGIKMTKDESGTWAVTWPVEPGEMLYKFYIDGVWGPDPDVAEQVDDGKGGYATPFVVKPKPAVSFGLKVSEDIKERKGNNFSPAMDYNRVDGVYLAMIASNQSNLFPQPRFYVEGGYSKQRNRWLYSFEIEQPLMGPFRFSLGGSLYDKTDSYDKEIITDTENFISSGFVKRDYRDYFDRRGVTGYAAMRPWKRHTVKVSYTSDEYRPLDTRAHAAIFRRKSDFAPNPHNPVITDWRDTENPRQICHDPVTGEKIVGCDKIILKAMGASYEFDSRDRTQNPCSGLWARLTGEWARDDMGGDLYYSRYAADLRLYNKLTTKQQYNVRLMAGAMGIPENSQCGCVPAPEDFFPKEFYVGGIGTMPGYDYKEFRGTHLLLVNMEYVYVLKGKMGLLFFSNGGDARSKDEREEISKKISSTSEIIDAMKFRFDAGVGIRFEKPGNSTFTASVAKRLDDMDKPVMVSMRLSRPF
ncbi:MAG: BamA/TamA family outer membrane protein [Candidatus Eisenbacteria bacterium]